MPKNTCKPWKGPPKKRSLTYRFLYHFRVKGSRGIVGIGLPRGDMRARIARVGRPPRYDPKSCEVGLSGCGIFHRVRFGPHSDESVYQESAEVVAIYSTALACHKRPYG